jgi:hypothetical protein
MGSLALRKIIYKGDKYYYSSKDLKKGVQIVEADNGAGKTTFSSLISYGIGMYVKQFDFKNDKDNHREIFSDTNNYVLLKVLINEEPFEFTRYFNPSNSNVIFVKGVNFEESFPIYRNAVKNEDDWIFSDWILYKLGIEVCEIFQGVKKFKINFSDLYRLIHYDQDTNAQYIYKEHRNDSNFVSDSAAVRKVIFELLVGYQFSEYYSLIGEYNKTEREKNTLKETLDNYVEMVHKMGFKITGFSQEELTNQLRELNLQLQKLEIYRKSLKTNQYNSTQYDKFIHQLRESLFRVDSTYNGLKAEKSATTIELRDLIRLKEDLILEVTQIKKIILAHEELNLFSPNTCPCCLREVTRKENHCICGNPIDESQYEKFFYSADEYLDILKSRQKSVETIETAIISCREELEDLNASLTRLELEKDKIKAQLREVEKNISNTSNDVELNNVNDKILEVKSNIQTVEQNLKNIEQYEKIQKDFNSSKDTLASLSATLRSMEISLKELMEVQIEKFDTIYSDLIKQADKDVIKAKLDVNYMPVINDGVYRQASSYVTRRLVYYLTLIKMSIDTDNVPFPRFLLIDTPENLGIDEKNLISTLSLIDELFIKEEKEQGENTEDNKDEGQTKEEKQSEPNFQIILTTGIGKFPDKFREYVVETLTGDNKLLKVLE